MKKIGVLIFILLLVSVSFVFAQETGETPDAGVDIGSGDVETVNKWGKEAGKLVKGNLTAGFKSNATKRIEAIDFWLEDNVGWMKYLFNMKPQISWLFAFNLYFILFFIVALILNSDIFFFIGKRSYQYFFGIALFIVLMVLKFYIGLANIIESWRIYIFTVLIPASQLLPEVQKSHVVEVSIWWGVLVFIILLVLLMFGIPAIAVFGNLIRKYNATKKAAKEKLEQQMGTESVNKLVEAATKNR
ncbi:hypothetical protein HOA55_03995 [archaeon]|nr:hypothetical protein [archaeon]MBT3577268.1 hypothetical protein [archaeon]MBT6820490.1 hypothetical protein [archaeon]MBT6955825.1 hypothetical protein [archaeon]MBT7025740.1 hypothetical protein [archaeon]